MTMTINDLQAALAKLGANLVLGPGTIDGGGQLDASAVLGVLTGATGANRLALTGATVGAVTNLAATGQPPCPAIPISGQASVLGAPLGAATGYVLLTGTRVDLRLAIALPASGWTFTGAFPGMQPPGAKTALEFDEFTFASPQIVLASAPYTDPTLKVDLVAGTNFTAMMSVIPRIANLITVGPQVRVAGLMVIDPLSFGHALRLAWMCLRAPLPTWTLNADLAVSGVTVALETVSMAVPIGATPTNLSWISLDGVIRIDGRAVDISAVLPDAASDIVRVCARFDGFTLPSLDALATLAGGADLISNLPEVLRKPTGIGLLRLDIGFSLSRKTIVSFAIEVGTTTSWPISKTGSIDFAIGPVTLTWFVANPFVNASRTMSILITGQLGVGGVTLQLNAQFPDLAISGWLVDGTIDVAGLIGQALTVTDLPALDISQLYAFAHPSDKSFALRASASDTWSIPVGPATLVVQNVSAQLAHSEANGTSTTTGYLAGELTLGGVDVDVLWGMPGLLRVAGTTPAVTVGKVVAQLTAGAVTLPSYLDVTVPAASFAITKQGTAYEFDFNTTLAKVVDVELQVVDNPLAKGAAIGFALLGSFRLSQVWSALSMFDSLVFVDPAVVFATFTDPKFAFANLALPAMVGGVHSGASFFGEIQLVGGAVGNAGKLIGASSLLVAAAIGADPGATFLRGTLPGQITIPGTSNLTLGGAFLELDASPFGVTVGGTVTIPIHDQTLAAKGSFTINTTEAAFMLDVAVSGGLSLATPLGFKGVFLDDIGVKLGVQFETVGIELGLFGKFHLGSAPPSSDQFAFEFAVSEEAVVPVLLSCHFDLLDLPTIFSATIDPTITLPPALAGIHLSNFTFYLCLAPTKLPDGTTAQAGFSLIGELDAYGWDASVSLQIDAAHGITGHASMAPVSLGGGALTITGANGSGPATIAVSTIASPYLGLDFAISFMGLSSLSMNASIANDGFTATITNQTIPALATTGSLVCTGPTAMSMSLGVAFGLDVTIGPYDVPGTNLTLGKFRVQTGFTGALAAAVQGQVVSGSISGSFTWQGQTFTMPALGFAQAIDLTAIAKTIEAWIVSEAKTIFASFTGAVLADAAKYVDLVKQGVVSAASDTATVLTGVYHESIKDATALLEQAHLTVNSTVHADFNGPHIDTPGVHGDKSPVHADVPSTHVDQNGPHVDTPTTHVDTPSVHVDTRVTHADHSVFGKHVDIGGHTDTTQPPHGDTTTPHGDGTPHADHGATPHGDTNTPHVDASPHADITPHVDETGHIDT